MVTADGIVQGIDVERADGRTDDEKQNKKV